MNASTGVYGAPPNDLADAPPGAIQFSPLIPGATPLEQVAEGSLDAFTMLTPPGTLERRYALALALRALKAGGGTRLRKELEALGCAVHEISKRHHRVVTCARPAQLDIESALAEGSPRIVEDLQLWSHPGFSSWDRHHLGTALLGEHLPELLGRGADFGFAIGVLAH